MYKKDLGALRDQALHAVERGKLGKAIELYTELEKLEPQAAQWSKRLGETHRRAGDRAAAVVAFERTVDKFIAAGFLVQAMAVCRLILQLDPDRTSIVGKLASLERPGAPPPPPPPIEPPTIPPGSALDALELASVVPGSKPQLRIDGSASGIVILELEPDPEPPELSAAARLALRTTPLFAELSSHVLESLVPRMTLVELRAGDVLFHEGDPGASLFVISEGEVSVETRGRELARLGPGAFFGEIALVTDLPRSATVRAATDVELLAIDRGLVREAAAERPEIISVLLRFVRDRLVDRMTQTSELFRPFADRDRHELAARFELVEVVPGSQLIVQGERADGLYLMVAGRVEVTRDGRYVSALTSGDVFGEMSLMSGGGSTADVIAASRVLALRLPARTFTEVIMTHPQVLAYLGEVAERRAPVEDAAEYADLHVELL